MEPAVVSSVPESGHRVSLPPRICRSGRQPCADWSDSSCQPCCPTAPLEASCPAWLSELPSALPWSPSPKSSGGRPRPRSVATTCPCRPPQEKDILPTAPFMGIVWASSHAVVLVNEMWRPGVSWTEATYWAARHIRILFVGLVISGDIATIIQTVVNAKRPYFIDACQPAVRLPNGTEVLACSGKPVAPGPRSGDPSVFGSGEYSKYRRVISWAPPTGDVTDYRCTGPKSSKSGDSFPSGHAAVAGFAGVFMFGYGIRRFVDFDQPRRAALLALDLGALVLLVCLQRVIQHKALPGGRRVWFRARRCRGCRLPHVALRRRQALTSQC
ncbi:hypothetical protein MTO96_024225 [Rhipicephalus appendiculatus]